jgi:hypothetical protein
VPALAQHLQAEAGHSGPHLRHVSLGRQWYPRHSPVRLSRNNKWRCWIYRSGYSQTCRHNGNKCFRRTEPPPRSSHYTVSGSMSARQVARGRSNLCTERGEDDVVKIFANHGDRDCQVQFRPPFFQICDQINSIGIAVFKSHWKQCTQVFRGAEPFQIAKTIQRRFSSFAYYTRSEIHSDADMVARRLSRVLMWTLSLTWKLLTSEAGHP